MDKETKIAMNHPSDPSSQKHTWLPASRLNEMGRQPDPPQIHSEPGPQAPVPASVDWLVAGTVHDFNNLLVIIMSHARMALNKVPADSPARRHLERAIQATRHAADLTYQLLADMDRERTHSTYVDLNQIVVEVVELLEPELASRARLHLALTQELSLVWATPLQMRQVVMNLLRNAADAIAQPPGEIVVRTYEKVLTTQETRTFQGGGGLASGPYVCLEVQDSGVGMTPETLAHIFEPYFTTKSTGRGIGLTATLGIIYAHLGGVRVESAPGVGTTFRVYLPALADVD